MDCDQKMSFDSEQEAQQTAIVAKHQHGSELKPYNCSKCDLWHLSSSQTGNDAYEE